MRDHELKADRAGQHLRDLNRAITSWIGRYRCSVRQEYEPEADRSTYISGNRFYMLNGAVVMPGQTAPTPPRDFGIGVISVYVDDVPNLKMPDYIGLWIGEFLHNLRSALDVLAYALTLAGPSEKNARLLRNSEFPIVGEPSGIPGSGSKLFREARRKYEGWDPLSLDVLEELQPYRLCDRFREHPLWLLHDLDNINKHRFIHPMTTLSTGAAWSPGSGENLRSIGPGLIESFGGPIIVGAPVVRLFGVAPVDPARPVRVDVVPSPEVVFDSQLVAAEGQQVISTLTALYDEVTGVVFPALERFL